MIDLELIKDIINDCPISNFSVNNEGVIDDDKLADYIDLKTQ